jgi:hypothetical protein
VRQAALAVVVLAALCGSGCGGPAPSCAGAADPPPVSVTLDARAWMHSHPATVAIVACVADQPCWRRSGELAAGRSLLLGAAPGSLPSPAPVALRIAVVGRNGHVLLRRSARMRPVVAIQQGPCGSYDEDSATFVLTATGRL